MAQIILDIASSHSPQLSSPPEIWHDHAARDLATRSWSRTGYAFTFIRRRLMRDRLVPMLPVVLNTYVPPSQVSPRRCYTLGRALRRAIERYPDDLKVAARLPLVRGHRHRGVLRNLALVPAGPLVPRSR
jgi:hypothetical protein